MTQTETTAVKSKNSAKTMTSLSQAKSTIVFEKW